jgi:DNA-binding GntR family transcriptional regulator
MSRTPVREALILLSAYNMVVMKPQIGTFVSPINAEWLAMEQFSRLTMEKEIIRQVCSKEDHVLYSKYKKNLAGFAEIKKCASDSQIRKLHELDNNFHSLAFASCGKINSFLHMHSYMQHIERLRVLALLTATDADILSEHTAIASAVMEQDTRTALLCLENHLNIYTESLERTKEKNPEYFVLG